MKTNRRFGTDVTQTELAKSLSMATGRDVPRSVISYQEAGLAMPTVEQLEATSRITGKLPTEMYSKSELDLMAVDRKVRRKRGEDLSDHPGRRQIKAWLSEEHQIMVARLKDHLGIGEDQALIVRIFTDMLYILDSQKEWFGIHNKSAAR